MGYGVWLKAEHVFSRAALTEAMREFFDERLPPCATLLHCYLPCVPGYLTTVFSIFLMFYFGL